MAAGDDDVTLTEQETFSWGSYKAEVGGYVNPEANFTISTKLGRVIWFEITSMEDAEVSDVAVRLNAITDVATELNGGYVFVADPTGTDEFTYLAIGTG